MYRQTKTIFLISVLLFSFLGITAVTATTVNIKLNDDLIIPGSGVDSFRSSPNGKSVVFTANQTEDSVLELFSVPATGGTNVKLNPPLSPYQGVGRYQIAADSAHVVYEVYDVSDGSSLSTLYAVPVTGGTPKQLATDMDGFTIAANNRVVYTADPENDGTLGLYSVLLSGSGKIQLNNNEAIGEDVASFKVTGNGEQVVYIAHNNQLGEYGRLFSVSTGGGDPLMLALGNVWDFKLTINNDYVVYSNMIDGGIFSTPVMGGDTVLLSDDDVRVFEISPDGSYVVYLEGGYLQDNFLYSVPTTGGQVTQLTSPMFSISERFLITPDGYVVFVGAFDNR